MSRCLKFVIFNHTYGLKSLDGFQYINYRLEPVDISSDSSTIYYPEYLLHLLSASPHKRVFNGRPWPFGAGRKYIIAIVALFIWKLDLGRLLHNQKLIMQYTSVARITKLCKLLSSHHIGETISHEIFFTHDKRICEMSGWMGHALSQRHTKQSKEREDLLKHH